MGTLSWRNFDKVKQQVEFYFELESQRSDLDWENLKLKQPYSLEAVENEEDLVGRKDLLNNIYSKLSAAKLESSIVYGQKRVGKTSIARTIQTILSKDCDFITIFIGTGGLDKTSPERFIKTLGENIVRKISQNPTLKSIEKPTFDSSLEPLIRYFENIFILTDKFKFVIIIDEFDEIPIKLYPYTMFGDSFFHNIRSISGEEGAGRVAFILVGGENMQLIMQNTDKLNKFDSFRVDYFDKSIFWRDFQELVTRPVKDWIEFDNDAINNIYEITEGNPFYTKYICKRIFKRLCDSRNAYVTKDDIGFAIRESINNIETVNVNHFWSDGIRVEDSAKRDLIETQRRKFLIAFSEIGRCQSYLCKKDLRECQFIQDLAVDEILEGFINRKIIIDENGYLRIKPKLFEKWLLERGYQILRSSFSDDDALQIFKNKEAETYVEDNEIMKICSTWGVYRGSPISVGHVRSWLNQFEDNLERRLMFQALQNLKFYNEVHIREKFRVIHESIKKDVIYTFKEKERVRRDILLSSFGKISKSGTTYTRMYASENGITTHNILNFEDIEKMILKNEEIRAIVFIDDIIATGGSTIEALNLLNEQFGGLLKSKNIIVVVGFICGFSKGIDALEKIVDHYEFNIRYKICDHITETDQCFSDNSQIFRSAIDRQKAKECAYKYGRYVHRLHPLGHMDSQLLIVFHDNCPNNTLPIFWASSTNPAWTPLFKRN